MGDELAWEMSVSVSIRLVGTKFSFGGDKNGLHLDCGDGCTTVII